MYSIRDILHPRYLCNLEWASEGWENKNPSEQVEIEEKKKQEELQKFTRFLLDSIFDAKTRWEAEDILSQAEERIFYEEGFWPEYDTQIRLLRFWIGSQKSIFDNNGGKRESIPLSAINDIEKLLGLPPERYKSMVDFLDNHPLEQHINDVMSILWSQGLGSTWEKLHALDKKLEEFKEQQRMWNRWVESHIRVILLARKIPEFIENNPQLKKEAEKYPNGMRFMRSVLIEVGTSKYPLNDINLQAEYERFSSIKEEDRYILDQYNPEFLYWSVLEHIKDLAKENLLSRKTVQGYINEIRDIVQSRLMDQKDSLIWKTYEKKFAQMEAIAANPILDDDVFEKSWKAVTWEDGIEEFLQESKKWEMLPWAVWKKNGKFHFYKKWEMQEYIMKKGELDAGIELAWKSYIDIAGNNPKQLKYIIWSSNINAFRLYVINNPDTNIFKWHEDLRKAFLEETWSLTQENTFTIHQIGDTQVSQFPSLEKLIRNNPQKYNQLKVLPKDSRGNVNGVMFVMDLIKGRDMVTPEDIQELQRIMTQEFARSGGIMKDEADRSRHRLRTLIKWEGLSVETKKRDDASFTWRDIINELWWETDLLTTVLNQTVKEELTPEKAKILQEYLLRVEKTTKDDPRKQEIIEHAKNILDLSRTAVELYSNWDALRTIHPVDLLHASKNEQAGKLLADASLMNTRTQLLRETYAQSIQRGLDSMPKELLATYHLPHDAKDIMEIRNYNLVTQTLKQLKTKKDLTAHEKELILILEEIQSKHQMEFEAYESIKVFGERYPEYTKSIQNIRENTEFLKNMSEREKVLYDHMATYQNQWGDTLEGKIGKIPPWDTIRLWEFLWWDRISWWLTSFSLPIQSCTITKTGTNTCSLSFPSSTGIGTVNSVPIVGIRSFLAQAEVYARGELQGIIPLIPDVNRLITKHTGKWTDSLDGTIDVYEMRRTLEAIAKILDIDYDVSRWIDSLHASIKMKYDSKTSILSHLQRNWILRPDWSYNLLQIEKVLQKMEFHI